MDEQNFHGCKIAILLGRDLLVNLRDDKQDIPFPNCWDLPGGGSEGHETPERCAIRETKEEFDLDISSNQIVWKKSYPSMSYDDEVAYFLVTVVDPTIVTDINFGNEGQRWKIISQDEFLTSGDTIPTFEERFLDNLTAS